MEEYKLTKEFFGGIIYNIVNSKKIGIDNFLYDFLCVLNKKIQMEEFINKYDEKIEKEELIDLVIDLLDSNLLKYNYFHIDNDKGYCDHLSRPFRVFYDITYECNLRCKHCFTNSGNKNEKELSLQEKLELVHQLKELGVGRVSIAGGEPFIEKDLLIFVKECKANNIEVSISTNGTLFSKELLKELNDCSIKNLTVSVDGGDKASADFIRGKGSFERVITGLMMLKKYYKNDYSIKVTLMKTNIQNIEEIIKIAIRTKCKSIKFNCVREDGRAKINNSEIVLSNDEYINVIESVENFKKIYGEQINIKAPLNVFCDEEYEYISELGFGCFAGKESFCVDPLGNVRPCSHFPKEFICGNIREDKLVDIWHKSEVLYKFRHLKGNSECKNCLEYDKCRGGCRFRAFSAGDINQVDPYCYRQKLENI